MNFIKYLYKSYNYDNYNIDDIYNKEYVIFLSKYDIKSRFFTKHNILNFYINDKDKILDKLNSNHNTHKIYFYDNTIEANVLYKKIKFSMSDLFVPITIYSIKKMDFKIKTLCQIAEKLGAELININYKKLYSYQQNISSGINIGMNSGINASANIYESSKDDENLTISMTYSKNNQKYNMNLNKYSLFINVELENDLFITKKDFDADIDLQFLIESRCNNFINDYNTNLTISKFNSFETEILLKAKKVGFKFDFSLLKDETTNISINIKFLNIYDNYTCINGDNITPSKNSFCVLYGFINEEKNELTNELTNEKKQNKLIICINTDDKTKKNIIFLYSKILN